jgi:hypothetical protein
MRTCVPRRLTKAATSQNNHRKMRLYHGAERVITQAMEVRAENNNISDVRRNYRKEIVGAQAAPDYAQ